MCLLNFSAHIIVIEFPFNASATGHFCILWLVACTFTRNDSTNNYLLNRLEGREVAGASRDLNLGPSDYKSDTLTTEQLDPGGSGDGISIGPHSNSSYTSLGMVD